MRDKGYKLPTTSPPSILQEGEKRQFFDAVAQSIIDDIASMV